ncbi:MAG: bifunctional DNA-formamidopyrimidine glycosylase/DNA-(apurinic or apyrimidinic site) lyase [Gemmataceae bacterium]
MPELPEVETVVRDLRPLLCGRTIQSVHRLSSVSLRQAWQDCWAESLRQQQIQTIERRGKWILITLADASLLVVHLGMTGQLVVVPQDQELQSHTHFRFRLDKDELRYRDIRRFGRVLWWADRPSFQRYLAEQQLGPEPFGVDPSYWARQLRATKRNLKATLLDQTLVAGVGNIYADEALFVAELHPSRRACDLDDQQAQGLRQAIEMVLHRAINKRGSSIRNYVGGSGLQGGFQDEFAVYGRTGKPCYQCATPIVVERYAGRSSHLCPVCQPPP